VTLRPGAMPPTSLLIERSAYSPELINRTLREWPRWTSLAEGLATSLPDAHRQPKGGIPDKRRAADRVADIERAIACCLRDGSLELQAVHCVQEGLGLGAVAVRFRVRREKVWKAYTGATQDMARALGWQEPDDQLA
jgi:hypothetical protein